MAWLPVLAADSVAAAPAFVRSLPSGPGSIRFVAEIAEARLAPSVPGAPALTIRIPGYDLQGLPGEAALPERVVYVAVPPTGPVRVRYAAEWAETREGVRIAALPSAPPRATEMLATQAEEPRSLVEGGSSRGPAAELLGITWMRRQRIAQIALRPAEYDARQRRLTIHRRIEVEVQVAGDVSSAAPIQDPIVGTAETDPFEPVYRSLLVNYEQGRSWRSGREARLALASAAPTRVLAGRGGAMPAATRARLATVVPDTSIFAGRRWVKIVIPETGFYRVEFGQVRNSLLFGGIDTTALDSLRLFTWPGLPVLPEGSHCDSCDYQEVAIGFSGDGNDKFDKNSDSFYFFALGASDWANLYDAAQPETSFINNPYETRNFYYLTIATAEQPMPGAPKRIVTASGALADTNAAVAPSTFQARLHAEQDHEYWPDATPIYGFNRDNSYKRSTLTWEKWFWSSITSGQTFREAVAAPGIESTLPARLRLRLWGLSEMSLEKSPGVYDHYVDVRLGPLTFPERGWNGGTADWSPELHAAQTFDTTFVGLSNGDPLEVTVAHFTDPDPLLAPRRRDRVGVAWFDLFYARRFEPIANELAFDSPSGAGTYYYRVGPFAVGHPESLRVFEFDAADPMAPPLLIQSVSMAELGPGAWQLRFERTQSGQRRYRILPDWPGGSRIVKPPNSDVFDAPGSSLQNLRGRGQRADYLLVFYDGFRAAADSLLRWRHVRLPLIGKSAPYDTASVPISALYDQFSGGRTDPTAIRNFLRAVFANWNDKQAEPAYVTLFGDASFDFKNLKGLFPSGQSGVLVPSYEGGYDLTVLRQYATDDWLLDVDEPADTVGRFYSPNVPDFLGGRIPADDAAGAMAYVHKLLLYERAAPPGEWHDRVMLIADDNEQGSSPDPIGWDHLAFTADLDKEALPPEFDRTYVYLHRYPDGPNDTKPGARADILEGINEGVVLFNYIGHGSPFKIADETVMTFGDADLLKNLTRPSAFIAASCDVGRYNDPSVVSLGERLILNPNGGCIAVISATELAFSNQNASLNKEIFHELFRREPTTAEYAGLLSQALLLGKSGSTNTQKYQLLGDAATRLALPRLFVDVSLSDLQGTTVTAVQRGKTYRVQGRVLQGPGGPASFYDGLAALRIEDSTPVDTIPACFDTCQTYFLPAAPMFRGDVQVSGGHFAGTFVVPMDARLGPLGRARAYVQMPTSTLDGAGSVRAGVLAGTAPTSDHEGPRISLTFPGGATVVKPDAVLRIDIADSSGVLITEHTAQNGIIVTIDGSTDQRREVTDSFRYSADSYQSGTAYFTLPGLSPGPHTIRVSASDNLASGITAAQHRSSATIDFEVSDNPSLRVVRAMLFPNPTNSRGQGAGGQFVIDAPGDSVNVLLRMYTVTGRLVRRLEWFGGLGQVQIPWDGRDEEGAPLANGVYLFQVQVNPRDAEGRSSARQKARAEGRFVIVNR